MESKEIQATDAAFEEWWATEGERASKKTAYLAFLKGAVIGVEQARSIYDAEDA